MDRLKTILLLLIILSLGLYLRLYAITKRGLFYPDEIRYFQYTKLAKENIDYFKEQENKDLKAFFTALAPISESLASKPGHILLGLFGLYMFGIQPYSVLYVSVFLGIGTIIAIYLLSKYVYDNSIGVFSAFVLSLCPAHILYSRSFMAHSNQAFFIVCAIYLFLRKYYKLSSLLFGFAFLIHPTGLIYFFPFWIYSLICAFRRKIGLSIPFTSMLWFISPLIFIEMISIFGAKQSGSLLVLLRKSYLSQIIYVNKQSLILGRMINRNLGPFHLFYMTFLTNGFIFTFLLALSTFYILKRLPNEIMAPFIFTGILWICILFYWQYMAKHERAFREILVLFPFFSIIIGRFIKNLGKKISIIICALILIECSIRTYNILKNTISEYPKLERFLLEHNIKKIITPSLYIANTHRILMPRLNDVNFRVINNMKQLHYKSLNEDYRYMLSLPGDRLKGTFKHKYPPIFSISDPNFAYYPSFYEILKTNGQQHIKERFKKEYKSIYIYELKKVVRV